VKTSSSNFRPRSELRVCVCVCVCMYLISHNHSSIQSLLTERLRNTPPLYSQLFPVALISLSNTTYTLLIRISKLKHVCGAYTSVAFAVLPSPLFLYFVKTFNSSNKIITFFWFSNEISFSFYSDLSGSAHFFYLTS